MSHIWKFILTLLSVEQQQQQQQHQQLALLRTQMAVPVIGSLAGGGKTLIATSALQAGNVAKPFVQTSLSVQVRDERYSN